jgi:hypothetical protein
MAHSNDSGGMPWFVKVLIAIAVLAVIGVVVVDLLHIAHSL